MLFEALDNIGVTPLLVALFVTLILYYFLTKPTTRYPPGPWGLPILGNVLQILWAGSIANFCEHNRKRFGNVFTIQLGGHKRVVLSGYHNFHYVLINNAQHSSTRSPMSVSNLNVELAKITPGVFWAPHPQWKQLRSLAISSLKDEGMGKALLEPQILEEIEKFSEYFINPHVGTPISIAHSLQLASSNLISQMVFGKRFLYKDEEASSVVQALNDSFSLVGRLAILDNVPFAAYCFKSIRDRYKYLSFDVIHPFFMKHVTEHRETLDPKAPRDVVDRYLSASQDSVTKEDQQSFSDDNCISFCAQLYSAGTETTSTALSWALLYICLYPDVLKKAQDEIDEQLGRGRAVTYKDRLILPYADAVLLEVLRKANIAPTAVPHTLSVDMEVDGQIIPAGADVLLNMASVVFDESVFEEPNKFKPERYLTGDTALKKQRTIPFGIGRRACLGESLARMEMFIFFVTFLQRYDVKLPEGSTATEEPDSQIISSPKPYKIIFTHR